MLCLHFTTYTSFSINVPIHTALSRMLLACAVPRTQLSLHAPIGITKLELVLEQFKLIRRVFDIGVDVRSPLNPGFSLRGISDAIAFYWLTLTQ